VLKELSDNDPYSALRIKEFQHFITARFLLSMSLQIQMVVVGWQVYKITEDPFSLGLIGLAEALPSISIALFGGHIADRFDRRKIILSMVFLLFICSLALFLLSYHADIFLTDHSVFPIYGIIFISGFARGILTPAIFSFWPQIIADKTKLSNAVTWNSTLWQISATLGPAIGGLLIAPLDITNTYLVDTVLVALSVIYFYRIEKKPLPDLTHQQDSFWKNLTSGIHFVFANQIILAAISLDLFAVLFGGAVALLPVFAKDILHVGAFEFGLLKAAMGVGSTLMALYLAYNPIRKKAGKKMLWAVAGFGFCTIGFGLSEFFWLSFLMLFLCGVFDGISVIVRGTLMQTYTPDHMKGRVSAVNNIFIGSSNEIGAFESGAAAKLFKVVPSVVLGGVMSLVVVAVTARKAGKLRKLDL
jgi:MFS family permease